MHPRIEHKITYRSSNIHLELVHLPPTQRYVLPSLPDQYINEGGLDLMIEIYKEVLPTCRSYIQDSRKVDMDKLQKILNSLSGVVEHKAFNKEAIDFYALLASLEIIKMKAKCYNS